MNEFMPDRIYAVGGGGIEIVHELLTQEWVLDETVAPRASPESVEVHFVDTALDNRTTMAEWADEIERRVHERREAYRSGTDGPTAGKLGDVSVESHVLTDDLVLTDHLDLTGDDVVDRIADAHAYPAENWWLEPGDVDEDLDLTRGVYRERGLARAILHKAAANDRSVRKMLDMPTSKKVAVVTGLGGGTGAGICLDLTRRLLEQSPTADVTLFGVLPSHREDEKVLANAYATLSELEAVQTDPEGDLFRDVVLMPIDPTGYEGKKGDLLGTADELAEFDAAVPYVLLAYYNAADENVFDQAPGYAPFTIGVPQVLRYSVDAIGEAHEAVGTAIDELRTTYEAGQGVTEAVEAFLAEHCEVAHTATLTETDQRTLCRHLSELERFAELDIFVEEGYAAAEQFRTRLADARDDEATGQLDPTEDDVVGVVEELHFAGQLAPTTGEFVDETDKSLATTFETAIEFLDARVDVLQAVGEVDDDTVREALRAVLGVDHPVTNEDRLKHARLKRTPLRGRLEDLEDEIEATERELSTASDEFEHAREERTAAVERAVRTWRQATAEARETLEAAGDVDLEGEVETLNSCLETFADAIAGADSPEAVDGVDADGVDEALDGLETTLETLGVDPVRDADGGPLPRSAVENSLLRLREARKASLRTDVDSGFSLFDPFGSKAARKRAEAEQTFADKQASLDRNGVFRAVGASPEGFDVDVTFSGDHLREAVADHLATRRKLTVAELADVLDEPLPEDRRRDLDRALEQRRVDDATAVAREIIEAAHETPTDLERRVTDLEGRLRDLRAERDRYEALTALVADQTEDGDRQRFDAAHAAYRSAVETYRAVSTDISTDGDGLYVEQVRPLEVLYGEADGDIATTGLLADADERARAATTLDDLATRAIEREYVGLDRRRLRGETARYAGHKTSVGVLTRAVDHVGDVVDVDGKLATAFGQTGGGTDDFSSWSVPAADAWDVGLAVFVSGVFLDNVRNLSTYREGYRAKVDSDDPHHLHHAYGLEAGAVVRRTETVNVADTDAVELFTGSPDERAVAETLRTDYRERVPVASLRRAASPADDDHTDDGSDGDGGGGRGRPGRHSSPEAPRRSTGSSSTSVDEHPRSDRPPRRDARTDAPASRGSRSGAPEGAPAAGVGAGVADGVGTAVDADTDADADAESGSGTSGTGAFGTSTSPGAPDGQDGTDGRRSADAPDGDARGDRTTGATSGSDGDTGTSADREAVDDASDGGGTATAPGVADGDSPGTAPDRPDEGSLDASVYGHAVGDPEDLLPEEVRGGPDEGRTDPEEPPTDSDEVSPSETDDADPETDP